MWWLLSSLAAHAVLLAGIWWVESVTAAAPSTVAEPLDWTEFDVIAYPPPAAEPPLPADEPAAPDSTPEPLPVPEAVPEAAPETAPAARAEVRATRAAAATGPRRPGPVPDQPGATPGDQNPLSMRGAVPQSTRGRGPVGAGELPARTGPLDLALSAEPERESGRLSAERPPVPPEAIIEPGPGPRDPARDALGRPWMTPSGGGTFQHRRPGYEARVAEDGSVEFKDDPSFAVGVRGPCLRCAVDDLQRWAEQPGSGHVVNLTNLLPLPVLKLDVTDWLVRRSGGDPYRAQKRKFLDATREERARMALRARAERIQESLAALPEFLAEIWAAEAVAVAERRRILFLLWDECAENPAGQQARRMIYEFIRVKGIAYPAAQLRRLNRSRTSDQIFAPPSD